MAGRGGRARSEALLVAALLALPARGEAAREGDLPRPLAGRVPVTLNYDRELGAEEKARAVAATGAILRDLGVEVVHDERSVRELVARSAGAIDARAVRDPHLLYDAIYWLADVARLPPPVYALFRRVVLVDELRVPDARSGRRRRAPLMLDPATDAVVVDHAHLNQLELFGNFIHPKVNVPMMLQLAVEARLRRLGGAALRRLGLELLVDDAEWARLNGGADGGFAVYNGEEVTFVGVRTAARVTPPGILYDALRELRTGVPANAYPGLADASQPWWSPRHGPAADRQNLLRCLFARSPEFFDRIAGRRGAREDRVLQEKTRLVLYGAFVATGGALDAAFWRRRHPGNEVVEALVRDLEPALLERLERSLDSDPGTRGLRLR